MQLATVQLAQGWSLPALRSALRSGDAGAINSAATAFYDRCGVPLKNFCAKLLRQSGGNLAATDAEDLALTAYMRVLELIKEDTGDKINDEVHLVRLLFRVARCLFIDTLRMPDTRNSRSQSDHESEKIAEYASPELSPEESFVGSGKDAFTALQLLFHDGDRWGQMMRASKASERHYRQYRALALYEIGEKLREDLRDVWAETGTTATRRLYRQLAVREAGMPARDWGQMEAAALSDLQELLDHTGLFASLRDAANAICDVDLKNRAKIFALRSEMGRFLAHYKLKWESIQNEL